MSTDRIVALLKKQYPSTFFSRSEDPFQVLISTVLSQRTRDENTERAARQLFKVYKTPAELANAPTRKVQRLIRPSGFYKVKAARIKRISRELLERFQGRVPKNMDKLLSLHGVGRKTANCVLVYAFKVPAMPVDTHVHRISNLIGWVKTKTPEKTEMELLRIIPRKYWIVMNELLVRHGQSICLPRRPRCEICPINKYCNFGKSKLGL
jgi:endonuclease-3